MVLPCGHKVLIALVIAFGSATIVTNVLHYVRMHNWHHEEGPDDGFEPHDATVVHMEKATTRCDDCIARFLESRGYEMDVLHERMLGSMHDGRGDDHDSDEKHRWDDDMRRRKNCTREEWERIRSEKRGHMEPHGGHTGEWEEKDDAEGGERSPPPYRKRREAIMPTPVANDFGSHVVPGWWVSLDLKMDNWAELKEQCPEVEALYVVIQYADIDMVKFALAHGNLRDMEIFPTHSYSKCIEAHHDRHDDDDDSDSDSESHERHHRRRGDHDDDDDDDDSDSHEEHRRDGHRGKRQAPTKPPQDNEMAAVENMVKQAMESGEHFTMFVDPENPNHAVKNMRPEDDHKGGKRCKGFMLLRICLAITTVVLIIVLIVVRCKKSKAVKIDDVYKKPNLYAVDGPVVSVPPQAIGHANQEKDIEKDPGALGPEVNPDVDVAVLSGKTLMMSGLNGDVTPRDEKSIFGSRGQLKMEESFPPVYEQPATPPPVYTSTVDMSKY